MSASPKVTAQVSDALSSIEYFRSSLYSIASSFRSISSREEWTCTACSYENADSSTPVCSVCGMNRESFEAGPEPSHESSFERGPEQNTVYIETGASDKSLPEPEKNKDIPRSNARLREERTITEILKDLPFERDQSLSHRESGSSAKGDHPPSFATRSSDLVSSSRSSLTDYDKERPPELMSLRRETRDGSASSYESHSSVFSSIRCDRSDFDSSAYYSLPECFFEGNGK